MIFKERWRFFFKPHENMRRLVKLMKQKNVKKILDLGCGRWRHTIFLVKEGFDLYGMDNSISGLNHTRDLLNKLHLKAKLKNASCYKKFPYKDKFFDAIIL